MKIKFQKSFVYQLLFALCVAVPYLNNYELTFLIWTFTSIVTFRKNYSRAILLQVALFSSILILAFFSSFFYSFKLYDFIRDVTYLIKPIIGLLIGYQLCRTYLNNPLKIAVNTGFFLAILHLLIVFYGVVFIGYRNIHDIRYYAGYFSDYEVYIIVILLFHEKFKLDFNARTRNIFLFVLVLSSIFYLSRTNFIQFVILFMALKGYFILNKRNITVLISFILFAGLFYSAVVYYNPKRNGKGIEAFLYKVKIAPLEPFKTKINKEDYRDFHDNYRSFENINTIIQVDNSGWKAVLFGKGLGSRVDLKQMLMLDETPMRFISVLHNGFMTVYLKSGLLGVCLLFATIFLLFKPQKNVEEELLPVNQLLVGTAIFLFVSYWVFMGFYFKADTKSILIGLLLAYSIQLKIKNLNSTKLL